MKRTGLMILLIVAAAIVAGYLLANRGSGSDAEQIARLIQRGQRGIESKSVGTTMSCVSKSYSDSLGLNHDRLRVVLADAFRSEGRYDCALEPPRVQVDGLAATAEVRVSLDRVTADSTELIFDGTVVLTLRKEPARRFLIFPSREWKVVRMDGVGQMPAIGI